MKLSSKASIFAATALATSSYCKTEQPNIVFILADDLGWQDVGFNGSNYFETPNLDKLAKQSVNFTNAYMYPTSSPSRAAIMTGRQSFRTQCYTVPALEKGNAQDNLFSRWTVQTKHKFYSQPLNEAGYKLIHLGKWHVVGPQPDAEKKYPFKKKLKSYSNGDIKWVSKHKKDYQQYYPLGRGYHENVGGTWWGDPARGWKKGYKDPKGGYIAPFKNPFIEDKETDTWLTDRLTDDAIDFIKRNKKSPFFVNLHYYAPHRPSIPFSKETLKKYQNKSDSSTGQNGKSTKEMAAYATMVERLDQNVGRLISYLDQSGLRENTIIVFTSDNGFNSYQSVSKNLRGNKGQIYEGGIKVPFLVNYSKFAKGKVSDEAVCGLDLFPTFLDFAGIRGNYKEQLDGKSIVPLLTQKTTSLNRPLFWQLSSNYKSQACSVIRRDGWKLIQFLKSGDLELYNLNNDPLESKNLAKQSPEKCQKLLQELTSWRATNNVPLPPSSKVK